MSVFPTKRNINETPQIFPHRNRSLMRSDARFLSRDLAAVGFAPGDRMDQNLLTEPSSALNHVVLRPGLRTLDRITSRSQPLLT